MNILTVDEITKAYGERKIFDKASFFLQEGEKAGILGINGTGKTTLLRMIVGEDEPDEGQIIRAKGKVISFLPQNPFFEPDENMLSAVLHFENYDSSLEKTDQLRVSESDAKAMLSKLGVTDFDKTCGQLSGGERKRLALVKTLMAPADILILDEPTNHLDQEMADWLEDTLKRFKKTILMITHDRYFLDSICNRILEVDKGKIYSYDSNYEGFLKLKAEREEMAAASDRKRHSILRTELLWVQRGARARSTKQKARLQRFEQMSRVVDVQSDKSVEIGSVKSRLGKTTIELHDISKAYQEQVLLRDFSYSFLRNDRIGFMGHNGCGKTTLMKIIMGEVQPDSGFVEIGQAIIKKVTPEMLIVAPEGDYTLYISKNGVFGSEEIVVKAGEETLVDVSKFEVTDEKKMGKIIFTISPSKAELYIDQEKTDYDEPVEMTCGIHQIRVKANGYKTLTQYIKVGQATANLNIELEESDGKNDEEEEENENESPVTDPSVSSNTIEVSEADGYRVYIDAPVSAELYVDGNYVGIIPTNFAKKEGTYVVSLRRDGYQTRSYTLQIDTSEKDVRYSFSDLTPK